MATEYRIIRVTEDDIKDKYRVQYKFLWFWRDVRKVVAIGKELPLTHIMVWYTVEEAREYIRKQGVIPDARSSVNFEVIESHITYG